ncbi:type III secretion system cytoplasmic ring protein SctQ [Halomonas elongata]|uniref:type III secretion system cytoplasmic ring protein SctQ n=1 Tax=Halomonas elongata TaxID=2746 RepID=UPI0038D4E4E4
MAKGEAFLDSEAALVQAAPARLVAPRLPRLSSDVVITVNAMSRPREPLTLSLGGHPLRCHLDPGAYPGAEAMTVGIVLDETPARLMLDAAALAMLVAPLSLRRSLQDCTPSVRALWLEYALLEWLEPMEVRLGSTIRLQGDVDEPEDPPVRLDLRLEDAERCGRLSLALSLSSAKALCPLLDTHCSVTPRACSTVPWPLQWVAGYQALSHAELRDLKPGDVVMLDRPGPETAAVVGGVLMAEVATHRDGMQLRSPLHVLTRGDFNMAQSPADTRKKGDGSQSTRPDESTLDRLPVRLVCEFGRLELSLGELRELDQGSVLPLSRPSEEAVDLVVNGKVMGRGRLVEVGDGLGVQIVRLATDD